MASHQLPFDQRTLAAFCTILEWADKERVTVTRTKMAKLLYLADLEAVRNGDRPATSIQWKWLHYGPFNNDLLILEKDLARDGQLHSETVQYPTYAGVRLSLVNCWHEPLDARSREHLRDVFEAYGRMPAGAIKDYTYKTAPMVEAQASGRRGVVLDLELARPKVNRAALKSRLRDKLRRFGENEPSRGDAAVVEAMGELAGGRGRANALLLGS